MLFQGRCAHGKASSSATCTDMKPDAVMTDFDASRFDPMLIEPRTKALHRMSIEFICNIATTCACGRKGVKRGRTDDFDYDFVTSSSRRARVQADVDVLEGGVGSIGHWTMD